MRWSIRIATVAGIGIFVHVTFILLVILFFAQFLQQGGVGYAVQATLTVLALFGCVILHELGHALTALRFGVKTRDITMLPIGGVARLERIPEEPIQELLIAIAGPAVNVVIAAGIFVILKAFGWSNSWDIEEISRPRLGVEPFLRNLLTMNVGLVVFNLIPAFPMDGGRILRSLLGFFLDHVAATRIAARVGQILAVGFALLGLGAFGVPPNPIIVLIAVFVFLGATGEAATKELQQVFRGVPASAGMLRDFRALSAGNTLRDAVDMLLAGSQMDFPVLDGSTVVGVLRRQDLIRGLKERGLDVPVSAVNLLKVAPVSADAPLYQALGELDRQQSWCLPLEKDGAIVGWITRQNVTEIAMVRQALGPGEPGLRN
jgi:Zn-dependent protease